MRILTVSHYYENHGGGIERVAAHLCRQFESAGIESFWCASDSDWSPDKNIKALPLACFDPMEKLTGLPMPLPGIRAVLKLARIVRQSDAIVLHDALYTTSILAMLLAKIYRKRTVLIQHIAGIPFSSPIMRFLMTLANLIVTRPMLRMADARVFISDVVRHELLGTPPRHPCKLLFNGVDHTIFNMTESQDVKSWIPNGSDARTSARRIIFVGRYVEKKGLTVIKALASLRPDLVFLLAGGGPIRPNEWGLHNVHDLGRQTPRALAQLYRDADLLLLPSVGEGYPLVIQEAMACGLPVVCGTPTHNADPNAGAWLRGVTIDLADPKNSARRCAEAIDAPALSPAERTAMAQYALAQYSWQTMARNVLTLAQDTELAASV